MISASSIVWGYGPSFGTTAYFCHLAISRPNVMKAEGDMLNSAAVAFTAARISLSVLKITMMPPQEWATACHRGDSARASSSAKS